MRMVKVEFKSKLILEGILGFIERRVTPFGTGAKVDCPKEYIGKKVYLVVLQDEQKQQ